MALTPILQASQVYSGTALLLAPDDPSQAAVFIQTNAAGVPVQLFNWDVASLVWQPLSFQQQQFCSVEAFGWELSHNDIRHRAPYHTAINQTGVFVPQFSCVAPSTSPLSFEILDKLAANPAANIVARGVFPPNVLNADAVACSLVDGNNTPITTIPIAAVAHLAAQPVGGHAAAPADGEAFMVSGFIVL